MPASISINPYVQGNFAGTFFASSDGYTQGDLLDDPSTFDSYLARGLVSESATQPMWGGLAITETMASGSPGVGVTTPAADLGSILTPAATLAALTGFTTLTRSTALLVSAQSRAPSAPAGGSINFVRLGTPARVVVGVSAAAYTAWLGGNTAPAVYWDTVNLVVTNAAGSGIIGPIPNVNVLAVQQNSRVVSYTSPNANWTENGSVAVLML